MPEKSTLEDVKSLVSEKYLGKAGIHGVGMRRSKAAVTLYVDPEERPDRQEVLGLIEKEIKPFNLLVVEEGQASITK
jgi:hypothetical protein